jgi:hypothetical protein
MGLLPASGGTGRTVNASDRGRHIGERGRVRPAVMKEGGAIDDLADLAQIIGVPRRDLRAAIGSPWHREQPAAYDLDIGPLFVGREGQSAAILCLSSASDVIGPHGIVTHTGASVLVGVALSSKLSNGTLGWRLSGTRVTLSRGVGTDGRAFLMSLHQAVARAIAAREPQRPLERQFRALPV